MLLSLGYDNSSFTLQNMLRLVEGEALEPLPLDVEAMRRLQGIPLLSFSRSCIKT